MGARPTDPLLPPTADRFLRRTSTPECLKPGARVERRPPPGLQKLGGIGDLCPSQPLPFLGAAERA